MESFRIYKKISALSLLIRGMQKAQEKNHFGRYNRMKRTFDKLDVSFIEELNIFMKFDDLGKISFFKTKDNI